MRYSHNYCLHKICILWNTLQFFVKKIVKCCWNVCGWLRKNRCSWLNEIWMASFNIKDCFLLPCIQSSYILTIEFLSKKTGNSSAERNLLHWTFILWLGSFNYLVIWLFINVILIRTCINKVEPWKDNNSNLASITTWYYYTMWRIWFYSL